MRRLLLASAFLLAGLGGAFAQTPVNPLPLPGTVQGSITLVANQEVWDELPWGPTLHSTAGADDDVPIVTQSVGPLKQEGTYYGGVRGYTFYHPSVAVSMISDPYAISGEIRGLTPANMHRKMMHDWELVEGPVTVQGRDRTRVTWSRRYNMDDMEDGFYGLRIHGLKFKDDLTPIL